jgi:HrpA-like RNA helicase
VAQSRVTQRQGRVGRLFPGDFYPLYTEATFRQLDTNQLPEIITSGIEDVYLAIIRTQQKQKIHFGQNPEFRVEDIALLDPPTPESFLQANATAIALGFVGASPQSHGLTPLGLLASIFVRTPMTGIRVLLAGYIWKAAASDLITAVAMFGSQLDDLYDKKSKKDNPEVSALQAALPSQSHDVKHIIADQFVGAILLFEMFSRQLDSSRGDLRAMVAWCKPLKLKFEAFKKIAQKRDIIIEEMFTAGLNPFRADNSRLSELSADKFTDGFTRVKRCLYDGLRGNCLQYQLPDSGLDPDYVSSSGLRVRVPDFLSRTPPNWIITDTIRLVKRTNGAYSVTTNLVSVLDNYVYPDQSFGLPRTFI